MKRFSKELKIIHTIFKICSAMVITVLVICVVALGILIFTPASSFQGKTAYSDVIHFYASLPNVSFSSVDISKFSSVQECKNVLISLFLVATIYMIGFSVITFVIIDMVGKIREYATPFTKEISQKILFLSVASAIGSFITVNAKALFTICVLNPFFNNTVYGVDAPLADFKSTAISLDFWDVVIVSFLFLLYFIFKYGVELQTQSDETL